MILIETRQDVDGAYETHWMVEPPALGVRHRVTEDTWDRNFVVRTIYAWEPA